MTQFLAISLQLAAPSLVAILMAEMFLGIANRLAPQVQIAFLGMALKSFVGLALLWAGWYFILQQIGKQSILWLQHLTQLIRSIPT
jgi:type III secretory pathway component EscT